MMKLIEQWGSGTTTMVTSCRKHGLLDPEFIDTGYDFRVVIRKNTSAGISRVISSLNTRQIAAFHFMVEKKPSISSGEYALLCDCTERTARTDLNAMMDLGVIIRTGKSKRTMYSISDRFRIVSGKIQNLGNIKTYAYRLFPQLLPEYQDSEKVPVSVSGKMPDHVLLESWKNNVPEIEDKI